MALHTSTLICRKTTELLIHISQIRPRLSAHPLLYTISVSQHTDPSELMQLVSSVQSLSNNSIGCLSAPIPSALPFWQQHTSVSLASFEGKHTTLFRSTIPGKKAVQVGRWHAAHANEEPPDARDYSRDIDWENALADSNESQEVPLALRSVEPESVTSVLYLSDGAPEGLSSALNRYTNATKLGFVGTSTPFITGRPYTLFHNDAIYSDGAVGVCLSSPTPPNAHLDFPGLEPVTRPMIVTSVEGNLVNALDGANPSRLLLHALQNCRASPSLASENISKELQVYLGTLNQREGAFELSQLFSVMSGDPSRGSIALDSDIAPLEGSLVQFFILPPNVRSNVLDDVQKQSDASQSLTFATTSIDHLHTALPSSEKGQGSDRTIILQDIFLAASENGCIINRRSEKPWKPAVPGGLAGLRWST